MLAIAGSPGRLRPHIKTHKLAPIVALQSAMGIAKCKCATLAEAEMAAGAGATDILLALQPVGPNQERLIGVVARFPKVCFSTIVDDPVVADALGQRAHARGRHIEVLLDLNLGQNRTGIIPGPAALDLYRRIAKTPGLRLGGLSGYDGHLHQSVPGLPDAQIVLHSEEHMVIETAEAGRLSPGTLLHAIPWHICPTVALHERVHVVQNGQAGRTWPVIARARSLQP